MGDTLGILVCSGAHMDYVLNLVLAARARKKRVDIFFTGKGTLLAARPEFRELEGNARIMICEQSFLHYGLSAHGKNVPESVSDYFATQAAHADMISRADRYVVF